MSHSVPDQRPPTRNDSRTESIDPSILRGADQILALIQQERAHAIIATHEIYQSSLTHQSREILQLEESLDLASKDIKKTLEENRDLAVQCQQQAEDLTFVLKTLAEELGIDRWVKRRPWCRLGVDEETGGLKEGLGAWV
ncbi:hypothetical protein K435DRAFT_811596 [Dendrothele bispora CBS 962.96]|uniref:Uncharacterized protein n=1 Tax=Dendrothele bispora (strain CBS 962.96) TaxID=1314807 RepID=A0A4S8KRM4_DENBC|nr:hypothetical protein K435DRAFT_811596 [Dendrothele bispora CBS 962.96]